MVFQLVVLSLSFVLFTFIFYLVFHYRKNYTHWATSGLPYIPFPRDCVFYPVQKAFTLRKFYNELAPHPLGGVYKMSRPYLLIRDPELVRRILIKDFSHFTSRGIEIDEKLDPLSVHIFSLKGDRWRKIRQKLTPVFSTAKLRGMWPLMMECKDELVRYLDSLVETRTQFEVQNLMRKFGVDVIGTCAFGLKCDAIQNEDCEYRKVLFGSVVRESHIFFLRSLIRSMDLNLISLLRWKNLEQKVVDFFFSLVRECSKLRAANADKRKDFMQHLINLQYEEQEHLKQNNDSSKPLMTDAVVAAQVFVFFIAGFETTAGTLAYLLYELALHPDVMRKCREEVTCVLEKYGGTLTYDSLKEMTYIQCVIDETLRKYPLLGWLDRICEKDYELPDGSYIIKRNTRILIPVYALHHDPKYFPEPDRFNPDRFKEENKDNIIPGTYLPFGDGPRICIGMRFAILEMKAAVTSIIMKYNIEPSEQTEIPLTFSSTQILLTPANGISLKWSKI